MPDPVTILKAFVFKSRRQIKEEDAATLLLMAGLDPNAPFTPGTFDKGLFYTALIGELKHDRYFGIKSISEGGFSVTLDKDEKRTFLYDLARESGVAELISEFQPDNIIEDKSYLW